MKSFFYGLLCLFVFLGSIPAFAQIGIGTTTPAPSAALEISSSANNKGILIPRITASQKDAIASPAQGLLIYQTTAPIGFYYYTGTSWKLMAIQTDIANKVDKVDGKDLSTNDYTSAEKTKLAAITGTNTGDQTTITGNAGTATKLAASKNINGVAFDGSADITITAAAAADQLTGTVAVANGGTGSNTLTGLIIGNGTNAMSNLVGTSGGEILRWNSNSNSWGLTGGNSLAIGNNAINYNQGANSIALGRSAGYYNQGANSTALGYFAANYMQNANSIALGNSAGYYMQGTKSIALGYFAGDYMQSANSIALGTYAGSYNQGSNSIAIGNYAGYNSQSSNSIVINASGSNLDAGYSGFYVKPIRSSPSSSGALEYNSATSEITYNSAKTFVINHPTKPDSYLVHSCLEGPEAGVYYRGESKIENNKSVTVTLPDYVNALANNFSIQITTIYEDDADENIVYRTSRVKNNMFNVYGKNGSFYWIVYGQRAAVEVEPIKAAVEIAGDGPYKYINRKK